MNVDEALQVVYSWWAYGDGPEQRDAARTLAAEVDRLRGELLKANADTERLEAELDRVNDDYHAQLETVHELNEALAATFPELERQIGRHPTQLKRLT